MNPLLLKTLRALVRRLAPKFLSVAYANRHFVVSCWPARRRFDLTPGNLRPLLRELGFGAPFFAALPMAALQVIWHGPDGLFSFRSQQPRSLQRGRSRRMETIPARQPLVSLLFESLETELTPAFLHSLGDLVGAPVVFNASDACQEWLERTPAYRWQRGRRSAVVAFGEDIQPALFWEGEAAPHPPPGPWLVSTFGPPVSDWPALLRRISHDLQTAAGWPPPDRERRGWSMAEFGRYAQGHPTLKAILRAGSGPAHRGQPDPTALAALAQLLGGGVRYAAVWPAEMKADLEPARVFPWLAALSPSPLIQQSGARREEITTEAPLFLVNTHRQRMGALWRRLAAAPDALRLALIAHLETGDERSRDEALQHQVAAGMSLFDWPALAAHLLVRPASKDAHALIEARTRLGCYPAIVDHTLEQMKERILDEDLRADLARLLNTFRERRETTLEELKGTF